MRKISILRIFIPEDYRIYLRSGVLLLFAAVFAPLTVIAAEDSIEKDIQKGLEQSKAIVLTMQNKLQAGGTVNSEMTGLKAAADAIRVSNLLLEERFKLQGEKVRSLGSKAVDRHEAMVEGYRKALTEYLGLIDSLPSDGAIPQSAIRNLQSLLDKLLPKKYRPIIGSLPYKHLNYSAQEPSAASAITPAYKGGNKVVSSSDTQSTPEAPISKEIADLAEALDWQPIAIYEYVKTAVSTEWYWGCMKGAEDTLRQKSGNDCDQAALLTALLRASGYPTRYVRGTIEFFPDIDRAKNITGIDDPAKIVELFQKAGIPYRTVVAGGKIANFQVDHIYVESLIPYANYRGAVLDEHGKTWLGLDTSIKTSKYQDNAPQDIFDQPAASGLFPGMRDEYLGALYAQTPLEYLQSRINSELATHNSQLVYSDFLLTRTLPPHFMKILPSSMQFTLKKATNEYTSIPNNLTHRVRFIATSAAGSLFDITVPLYTLSNQQIVVSFEPETVQDQEIIDAHGGLDNTPAYLVRLRPVLKLNDERLIVAADGLPMGETFELTVELQGAEESGVAGSGLRVEKATNTLIVGNLTAIGIVAQRATLNAQPATTQPDTRNAEQLLYTEAINYTDRWYKAEDELASLLHLTIARPLPAVVSLGGLVDVTYFFGIPYGFTWKGVYVDADHRSIETVAGAEKDVATSELRVKTFMQLSSLQGSILENRIFEDDFKVEAISTAKLFQLATGNSQPVTIDKTNVDAILATLSVDDTIKEDIANSVNQNFIITMPNLPAGTITHHDWTGIGFIKEDSATGESGWMLSGMIAGGSTVELQWPEQRFQSILSTPYSSGTDTASQPGGVDGQPVVVEISPSDGEEEVAGNARVTVVFNEPVTNVDGTTVKLFDLGPADIQPPAAEPVLVSAAVFTSPDNDRMRATIQPESDLIFGHRYQVTISPEITDVHPNSSSACSAHMPSLPEGCFLPLDREYTALFTTTLPQASGIPGPGSAIVSVRGGTLTVDAGDGSGVIELTIPEGALAGPALIKLSPITEAQLPKDNPVSNGAKFLAAVKIESSTKVFGKELQISVPVPSGMPADAVPFVAQPQVLVNADGTEEKVYVIVDSAKVVDNRLMTASPPFDGVLWDGIYAFIYETAPFNGPVIIAGYTFKEVDGQAGYAPGSGDDNDKPIKDAVIRAAGASNFVSYSRADGHYACYGFSTDEVCRSFATTATNPYTMHSRTANIVTCDAPYIVNDLNFRLAEKDEEAPDTVLPTVAMSMYVVPGQENDPQLVADTVPVGTDLAIPISVIDEQMGDAATLTVSYTTADGSTGTSWVMNPVAVGSALYSPASEDHPARRKYSYQTDFVLAIQGSLSTYFRPQEAGTYTITLDVADAAGNKSSRTLSFRALPSAVESDGIDGQPIVEQIVPADGSQELMVNIPIIVTFSEPVMNVDGTTVGLLDLGPVDSEPTNTQSVDVSIYTSFEAGHMLATLQPQNNLIYGHRYQVVVTQGITDSKPNSLDRCSAQTPSLPEGCFLPLDREYTTVFSTKRPQTYDLTGSPFTDGRDIELYTDQASGRTYAYVVAGSEGWYVVEVTDPAMPVVVGTHKLTDSGVTWYNLGVAIDPDTATMGLTEKIDFASGNNYANVRFYDLATNPQAPVVIGRERLAEGYSGVPNRLALANNYAYIATFDVGLQVVDINAAKARNDQASNGSTIVNVYPTIEKEYGQPWDIVVYKGNKAILTTGSGHMLLFDLSVPESPQLMNAYPMATEPDCTDCVSPIAVAPDYSYTSTDCGVQGTDCGTKVIDLAVVSGKPGRIHTIDVTDPYNPAFMGTARDDQGNDVLIGSVSDIAVSKTSSLAYVSDNSAVYIIDIKDPKNPKLLNILPIEGGNMGLAELNGWLFFANSLEGMKALDLHSDTPTVEVVIDPTPVIAVDVFGHPQQNYTLTYSIKPESGYYVQSASVTLYRNAEALITVPAVASGQGAITILSSAVFNPADSYSVEVKVLPDAAQSASPVSPVSRKAPLSVKANSVRSFGLERAYHLSQFDDPVPGLLTTAYTDGFETFAFSLQNDAGVSVKILDENLTEMAVLVPAATLAAGEHKFLVDYYLVQQAGFDAVNSPYFYILQEVSPGNGEATQRTLYPGKLYQRSDGKMLGQTLVHDVLIQDGSLNLSRQDFSLKGRGPQLAFSRSYNNQPSPRGYKPFGEGWSHSLDMKLRLFATGDGGPEPQWAVSLRNTFYTADDEQGNFGVSSVVQVNGTVFKRSGSTWYAERGHHGTLTETSTNFVYTAKDGTRYTYPYPTGVVNGLESSVQRIEDRNGNAMTFSYNANKQLTAVTDAVNRSLTFTYEQLLNTLGLDDSRLVKVTGPDNIEIVFAYNAQGYLASAKRGSRVEQYAYQLEPTAIDTYNLVRAADANNHSYSYAYYGLSEVLPGPASIVTALRSQDMVKTVTYPDQNSAQFQYAMQTANIRTITDLRGNNTVYTLNYYGNPIKIEEPLGKTTLMTWSIDQGLADNVMTSKTDPRTNKTTYEYDAKGNIAKETDPYNNFVTTTWNQKFSLPESRTDRNGKSQTWQYNSGNGNLDYHIDGDNKRTSYSYYNTGEVETATDPRDNTTTYTYDAYGNLNTVAGQEGSVTDHDFDIRGRQTAVKDPNGKTTSYTYDALDYPATIVHPAITAYALPPGSSTTQRFTYDAVGNLLSETNRNGLTLTYTYTARNQVETVGRSIGNAGGAGDFTGHKSFTYDPNGSLLTETDWLGRTIKHTYNALNQRDSTTNRLAFLMSMGYDLNGNLTSVTDYEGKVTTYEYDKLNRQTDMYQPALDGQEPGHIVKTYYNEADPKTNLKTETDQEKNTSAYEYNGRYLPAKRTNALLDNYIWTYDDSGNLWTETDEEGNVTTYDYDRQNRRTAVHKTVSGHDVKTEYQYDANGNRTHIIDPLNHDTETRYDEWNRPWQGIDADNFTSKTEYDGEGNPVKTTDGNGNVRTLVRDVAGQVLSATDAEGNTTAYAYDQNGNVKTATDALGTKTITNYDYENRPTTITEADGTTDERVKAILNRDKMGNPLQVQDYNGNVATTTYNALNLPSKVFDPSPFSAHYTETKYYKTGKVKSVRNRRGYTTLFEYDVLNRETKATDPLIQTIETTYDKVGNVKTRKDKRDIATENFYDSLYRLERTERAGTRLITNEYDDAGNKTASIDANSNRTEYAYNNRNLLKTTTYPDTTTETRTYDGVGNVLTVTNEETKVTTFTYDKENRQTSIEFAGEKTEKTYDEVGNLALITKPKQNKQKMDYDRLKRLTTVIDDPSDPTINYVGLNLETRFEYDANGNLRHQYDARNNHVEYNYDALNRKTKHTQRKTEGNLATEYTFDEEGNLTGLTDPKGQSFTYAYDELNRRMDETYPNVATPYLTVSTVHTDYDPNNNVTNIIETKATTTNVPVTDMNVNEYDDFDRLTRNTQRGTVINFTYDNNGNRTSVASPSGSTSYTFNSRNRLEIVSDGTSSTSFTYYPDGKNDTVVYPNGTDVKYTYWPANRVKTVVNKATVAGSVISSYAYEYDGNGNRTSQTEIQDATTETTAYTYDTLDRMKSFTVTGSGNTTLNEYTFEGYNRKTEKVTLNGAVTGSKTYTYDETDWLTKVVDNADSAKVRTIAYTYDKNGNTSLKTDSLSPDQNKSFDYDSLNRLVQAKDGSNNVLGLYDYNSTGLRIRHRYSDRGDVDYFYDGRSVIDEYDAASGSSLAHYRYADRLLSLETSNPQLATQYYHHDGLGSTVNLTDGIGTTQVSYHLDPWGNVKSQSGYSINRNIFTDKEHDLNTGLVYFGARYYDPDTARFITQDSYLGEPGTPPSLHRYLYAYSNPTVFVDLEGYLSLPNHRLTSTGSLNEAVDKGSFEIPGDESDFTKNLQIGSMIPDIQSDKVAEAIYWSEISEKLPFASSIRNAKEWIDKSEKSFANKLKAGLKKIAPETYLTIETVKHWWDDSDLKQPVMEKAAEVEPRIKEVDILRTHFYDKQWQHGMGETTEDVRAKLIRNTVKSIGEYKKLVEKGDNAKAAQELGIVLHYLEDTWTPSHVTRDNDSKIKYMYDYTKQSPKLHAEQDKPDHDSTTIRNAIKAGVELLEVVQKHGDDPKELEKQLRENIYPIDFDKNYPNPYAPRASKQDAINGLKNYSILPGR